MDTIVENINKFLSAVMKTRIFQEMYWYLVRNNFVVADKVKINELYSDHQGKIDGYKYVYILRFRPRSHGTGCVWSRHLVRSVYRHIYSYHFF